MATRALAALLCLAALCGCATLSQRFPPDVAASFAREDMRRLETRHLQLYYPARFKDAALNIAARLEQCAGKLRAHAVAKEDADRFLVFLTSSDFNNAYVQPVVLGSPQQMVLPMHMSLEAFDLYDIGTNAVGDVSCHEAVHYVTFEQVAGFWRGLNFFFGGLFTPQSFLDSWFHEGMATYYEARLGKPVGRPLSPYWRGAFAAGLASEESLPDPGFLNSEQRLQDPYGPQYLTGQAFVSWLAARYGEEKLWQLIDKQARSIFSPLWVTLRFKSVYGQSIGSLFDEFTADVKGHEQKRTRPETQRVLAKDVGFAARIAVSSQGVIASVSEGRDQPTLLTLRDKDGTVRVTRHLKRVLPFRPWIVANPVAVSGMSFSPDGKWLFMVSADVDAKGSYTGRLLQFDASTGVIERTFADVLGPGGSPTADGKGYVYVAAEGDTVRLMRLNLADDRRETLITFPPAVSVSAPACAPDGARIAFVERGDHGLDLFLREDDGTIVQLTDDGRFNAQPRWLDDSHLLFVREADGRTQAHLMDVATRAIWATTDAPFGVVDPVPLGPLELAFLNRDGWGFSLDAAPLVPQPAEAPTAAEPTDEAPDLLASAPTTVDIAAEHPLEPVPPLEVKSDEPYSPIEHLFIPTLHVPFLALFPELKGTGNNISVADVRFLGLLSLTGSDRLEYHSWALNVSYDSKDKLPSVSVAYGNHLLAPFLIDLSGALVNVGPAFDRAVVLGVSRTFWTTPVRLEIRGVDHHEIGQDDAGVDHVTSRYRLIGAGLSASYFAAETTSYGGIRRGLGIAAAGSVYPKAVGSDLDLGDVAGELDVWVPLPISKRHTFNLSGRGRALLSKQPQTMLEVGGVQRGFQQVKLFPYVAKASDLQMLSAPGVPFSEYLRGYQDLSTSANAYAVVSATYSYPIIIDYGWASLLYLFPALFIRQIDVELFGEAAWLWPNLTMRRSVGGALHVRTSIGNLPVTLFFEVAERFDANEKPLGVLGIALE